MRLCVFFLFRCLLLCYSLCLSLSLVDCTRHSLSPSDMHTVELTHTHTKGHTESYCKQLHTSRYPQVTGCREVTMPFVVFSFSSSTFISLSCITLATYQACTTNRIESLLHHSLASSPVDSLHINNKSSFTFPSALTRGYRYAHRVKCIIPCDRWKKM